MIRFVVRLTDRVERATHEYFGGGNGDDGEQSHLRAAKVAPIDSHHKRIE